MWVRLPPSAPISMHDDEEILDLVNEKDEVIGQMKRSQVYDERLHNFRVVNAFIKNDRGQLWIPRRSKNKRSAPLCLDMSVGGHVTTGETYNTSFIREAQEEVRIDLTVIPFKFLGKFTPDKDGMYAFQQVYEISSNDEPDYNTDDFVEAFWMTPEEIMERLAQGDKAKSDLPKLVQKIYLSPMAG